MPNQFNGQVFDSNGKKLSGVKVTITSPTIPSDTSTTTDVNGNWLITIKTDIDSKDVTVTFSKSGLETTSIANPQQTAILPGYIDPEKGGTLDLAGDYPSGKWKVASLSQETQDIINKEINDAYAFATTNIGNFKLEIESSESQVPNADNEGTNKNFSKPGSLAKARAEALQEYINNKINILYAKETNPSFQKPTVILGKIDRVGDVAWDQIDANANKYTKDQYTRVKADFINKTPDKCSAYSGEGISVAGSKKLKKQPGDKSIKFKCYGFPDRMGVNGVYQNFYSISGEQDVPLELIQFIVYATSKLNPNSPSLPNASIVLLNPQTLISNLTKILGPSSPANWKEARKQFYGSDTYPGILKLYNITSSGNSLDTAQRLYDIIGNRGIMVKQGETSPISLQNIQDNQEYEVSTINGYPASISFYEWSICK